jgi:acetyl esterase
MALQHPVVARLALRGAAGRLWSDLHRPAGASGTPLLVFFPDAHRPVVLPEQLCQDAGLAVLVTRAATPADAVTVVEWAAEHAADLGADPARLLVGGERAGARLAAAVARHAGDRRWPPLLRQVLVRPDPGTEPAPGSAPATVVTSGGTDHLVRLLRRHDHEKGTT